jgi:flagellar M-ring protein FliF
VPVSLLGPLKCVGLSLALLIFCFFMVRFMKRRENETLAEPSWLLDRPTPLAALEAEAGGHNEAPTQALTTARRPEVGMLTLEQLAEREPERVAAQVRAWMSED